MAEPESKRIRRIKNGLETARFLILRIRLLCDISKHEDEVAYTSEHDKNMEKFVSTEVDISAAKDFDFQCVNHTAYGVKDASCEEP